jgi:hypothetical protein
MSSAPFHPAGKRPRLLLQKRRRHRSPPAAPWLHLGKQRSSQIKNTRSPSSSARRPSLPRRRCSPEQRRRRPTVPAIAGDCLAGEPLPSFYLSRRISFGCIGLDHLTEEVLPDLHRPDSF